MMAPVASVFPSCIDAMPPTTSVRFFDEQFQRQAGEGSPPELNPFEQVVLPHLRGRLLDLGCGLGR